MEDDDAVAGLDQVCGLGADQQHAHAVLGGAVDGGEQVGARTDVDGLGRLVQHEQDRLDREPLGEQHLLLVAAAELLDQVGTRAGPDRQALDRVGGEALLPASGDEPGRPRLRTLGRPRLSRTLSSTARPSRTRRSGTIATPARISAATEPLELDALWPR